jgi:hypothetical protein
MPLSIINCVILNTIESHYVKLGLLEMSVKSTFVWRPVLRLAQFNLIYSSYLKFRYVEISGFVK